MGPGVGCRGGPGSSTLEGSCWRRSDGDCPVAEGGVRRTPAGAGLNVAEPEAGLGGVPVVFGVDGPPPMPWDSCATGVVGRVGWFEGGVCPGGCRMGSGTALGGEEVRFSGAPGGNGCLFFFRSGVEGGFAVGGRGGFTGAGGILLMPTRWHVGRNCPLGLKRIVVGER